MTTTTAEAPIGVFDSGLGGLSVLRALRAELPHEHFTYFADTAHAPYGERSDEFVAQRALAVARELVQSNGIKALVVACNTATAAAIHLVREAFAALPVVGVEPGLKPATAVSGTGRIGVLATRGTLASAKFDALHASLAGVARFTLQPCDGLADAIERGDVELIRGLVHRYVDALGALGAREGEIDTIVLGCTHYPLVLDLFRARAGEGVHIVETGAPVARRTRALLAERGLLAAGRDGGLTLRSSGARGAFDAAAARWLG